MTTQITANMIQASVGPNGIPIYTLQLIYPRFIHAEAKTHRLITIDNETWSIETDLGFMDDPMLSRNAASSRAIPITKMAEHVKTDPAAPIHWGVNQKGMQAEKVLPSAEAAEASNWWDNLGALVADEVLNCPHNLHKQILNRPMEAWQWMVVVVTATNWENFFHLRCHKDAQPEILELANLVKEAIESAEPMVLKAGELHVPFVYRERDEDGLNYYVPDEDGQMFAVTPDEAIKVSASASAQTSFRAADMSLDKAIKVYDRLVESKPVHASPFEHQAIALESSEDMNIFYPANWPKGITHMDRDLNLWSGNFMGWVQNRQLINAHDVKG